MKSKEQFLEEWIESKGISFPKGGLFEDDKGLSEGEKECIWNSFACQIDWLAYQRDYYVNKIFKAIGILN